MAVGKNERGKWTVRIKYRHPDGRLERIRETSPVQTKRGAEAHERQIRLALQDGSWRKLKERTTDESTKATSTVKTLAEYEARYFELCRAVDEKPGSLESKESAFRAHLLPLFGDRTLNSFTSKDGNTLLTHFAKNAASTYNNHATVLNSVLEVAKGDGVIAEVPWQFQMRKRKKPKNDFHEPEVYESMVAAAQRLDDTTAELAVLVTGEAGLRRGEAYALLLRNCRIRERVLIVEDAELVIKKERVLSDPKGRKSRTVDMTDRIAEALERHIARTGRRTGRVFLRPNGTPFTDHTWKDMMARVEAEAGFADPKGRTHIQRHTYCSHLAMLNVPAKVIQTLAGHESMTTTERYMHLSPAARSTARERLNNRRELLGAAEGVGANIGATAAE